MKINTALILCAGYGKRLNPLTLKNPKPLLKVKDLTFLERTIKLIKNLGIKKIIINTFYLEDKIFSFIKEKNFDIEIDIVKDGNEILDTGGGILNMIKHSKESYFLVFNPDTLWSENYLESIVSMEKFYFSKKIENILMVINKDLSFDKNLKGDFIFFDSKLSKNINANFIYIGCQIISKNLFNNIDSKVFSISKIWNNLIKENELYGFEDKNNFYHATNFEVYQRLLKN
tara:strand:- start:873 stop:1562 length:690 start_codon:yes stop_codon:yes gene_type:complete